MLSCSCPVQPANTFDLLADEDEEKEDGEVEEGEEEEEEEEA